MGYIAPEVTPARASIAGYGLPADIWSAGVCLHVMLCGSYPFAAPTDEELLQLLSAGPELRLDGEAWAAVSPQARDLLARMLSPLPQHRPSAAQALRHEWFALAADDAARQRAELLADAGCAKVAVAAPAAAEAVLAPSPPPSPMARMLPCFRRRTARVAPLLATGQTHELAPAESAGPQGPFADGFASGAGSLLRSLQSRFARKPQLPEAIAEAPAEASAGPPALPLRRRRLSSALLGACLAPDAVAAMRRDDSE